MTEQTLRGLRVLDLCDGLGDGSGRYLADLGAEVILVEAPGGSAARVHPPLIQGQSTWFAVQAANKLSVELDVSNEADRSQFAALAADADILLHPRTETALNWLESITHLTDAADSTLVTLAISEFGDSGPYAGHAGSNAVHMALAGNTARSGLKGREPLLPPAQLSYASASIQAAWVALVGFWQRLHTGRGGKVDFSVFEATCQVLDPALGVTGSAAAGKSATALAPRGRAPEGKGYPFFRCADGFVRICVLNPRQWHAMCEWLGDDHPFTDPSFAHIGKRTKHMRDINALIQELFLPEKCDDLVADGQRRGVPIAAVATPDHVLHDPHFVARGAFRELQLGEDLNGSVPAGFLKVNGQRAEIRQTAPVAGSHTGGFSTRDSDLEFPNLGGNDNRRPLEGIRVLDLGVIVAGAETGRLLADQGAEVIKIESSAFRDGLRQSWGNEPMTESFAQGSRGKKSLGLNLRSEEGKRLFKELVAKSDVVLSNFKPGTMEKLGFDYGTLKAINPRIITSESSALGGTGPMSKTMGYGPLVRASAGLTGLWRYPDDERGFGDALTIFPDHLAARVTVTAVLALLLDRERTGQGGTVSLAQAETILNVLAPELLAESLQPGWLTPCGNRGRFDAPSNLFACAGDDEWCAIDVQGDEQWQALCELMGRADLAEDSSLASAEGRVQHCERIEEAVSAWTEDLGPSDVADRLQAKGIAAGMMMRIHELADDPHLQARDFFRVKEQPGLDSPLMTENGPAGKSFMPDPALAPAPFLAEHTRPILKSILNLDDQTIDALIESGDLEEVDQATIQ